VAAEVGVFGEYAAGTSLLYSGEGSTSTDYQVICESHVVWHKSGSRAVVSRLSQESLLPRLAAWRTAQSVGARLQIAIESNMARAPFTLGLGEPNLSGKPILEYDRICTPLEVRLFLEERKVQCSAHVPLPDS
jgi:hypothetical protein